MALLGRTDLDVLPLCLGTNTFLSTTDEQAAWAVLDRFVEAGGALLDSADMYTQWHPGNGGGESEAVIGRWMAARGNRDDVLVATKVGKKHDLRGLAPASTRTAVEASLRRLQTDRIDLYYAHEDDRSVPQEQSAAAFDALVREGKVRWLGASNFTAARLASALETSEREGLARYEVVQPRYNLLDRVDYEDGLRAVVAEHGLSCLPYYGLARGYLTGKWAGGAPADTERADSAAEFDDDRGRSVVKVVLAVAAEVGAPAAAVALAWLRDQPTVGAPIAGARYAAQLDDQVAVLDVVLTVDQRARLDAVSS